MVKDESSNSGKMRRGGRGWGKGLGEGYQLELESALLPLECWECVENNF